MKTLLTFCAVLIGFASSSQMIHAQLTVPQRAVQFRSVDFVNSVIEVHNFGEVAQSLNGWRFCSHDENQQRQYTTATGLNGMSLGAGESMFIHFNNDADPAEANQINRTSIPGSFALPLDINGAYAIQFYFQTPFAAGANIADHIQMSLNGVDNVSADDRSDEAQAGGVWINQSDWISINADTDTVFLLESSSMSELHSPADYEVVDVMKFTLGDVNCDGVVNLLDVGPFVDVISSGDFDAKADINRDNVVNLLDVTPFVSLLSGG